MNKEKTIDEYIKDVWGNDVKKFIINSHAEAYIHRLERENQQLKENYNRIYNENCKLREEHNITDVSLLDENYKLKKQKDDVVSEIKRVLDIWENKPNEIATLDLEELLRMLGEIDD